MDTIRFDVVGAREVGQRFDEFPQELHDDLKREIEALTAELFAMVESATPQRTGKLRSEEAIKVIDQPERIAGLIYITGTSADFAKAGALEYGAHRSTQVAAHAMRLDHVFGAMLNWPMTVIVSAYSRTPDIEAVAFERGPLAEMEPEILERLNAVVEGRVAETNA
jgi:hypothetical protein